MQYNEDIDIIIPWVDGNDPEWLREREKTQQKYHINEKANSNVRYESWDNLQFIFRGIEKFMSWVHCVFLVTCGHLPSFLNVDNPKLKIIKHSDYIPKEYLPTFNSNVIELNYHRIDELSENFILFNDDCFPLLPIPKEYYFRDGLPCDEAVESPIMPVDVGAISNYASFVKANNVLFINRHFNKREVQKKNWGKWYFEGYGELLERNKGLSYWNNFAGFHDYHMPVPLKKSTLQHLWDIEYALLDNVSRNQFRHSTDLSQCIVRYWQLCEGNFIPQKSEGKPYLVTKDNYADVAKAMRQQISQMVCLTEDCTPDEFIEIKRVINEALEEVLPEKSSFEK
jgi:hypothetical protein